MQKPAVSGPSLCGISGNGRNIRVFLPSYSGGSGRWREVGDIPFAVGPYDKLYRAGGLAVFVDEKQAEQDKQSTRVSDLHADLSLSVLHTLGPQNRCPTC